MDQKKIDLLKKLKTLAEQGIGGEKETAQKKLEQLMQKYNVEEQELLLQVGYKVLGKKIKEKMYEYRRGTGKKTTRIIECTKAEALRIRIEHEFYCNLWKEEQDFLFECFIQKHRIFTSNDEEKNGEGKKLTMAEKIRMNAAMKAMQDKSMTQRIEG